MQTAQAGSYPLNETFLNYPSCFSYSKKFQLQLNFIFNNFIAYDLIQVIMGHTEIFLSYKTSAEVGDFRTTSLSGLGNYKIVKGKLYHITVIYIEKNPSTENKTLTYN